MDSCYSGAWAESYRKEKLEGETIWIWGSCKADQSCVDYLGGLYFYLLLKARSNKRIRRI